MVDFNTFHIPKEPKPNRNFTVNESMNHTNPLRNHLLFDSNSNNLKIFHQNIRGLTHKIDELLISLTKINPQVLCITEHHLTHDEVNNINLEQYTLGAHFSRNKYKQGGVAIFVLNNIQYYNFDLTLHIKEKDFEICAIKIQVLSTCLLIMCIYTGLPLGTLYFF